MTKSGILKGTKLGLELPVRGGDLGLCSFDLVLQFSTSRVVR